MSKSNYDAIIIGSGVGGLTCGSLLAKHGMDVLIIEQHFQSGGCCTSYKRKEHLFDVPCIIGGMRKGDPLEQLLTYIGVTKKIEFLEIDKLAKLITPDLEIDWYIDSYKLECEFTSKFPDERCNISRFFVELRKIWYEISNAHYKPSFLQKLLYPLKFPRLVKYNNYTLEQLLSKFIKNEKLKELLGKEAVTLGLSKNHVSALLYVGYIMGYAAGGIWYPKGGFQRLSNAFADCFEEYGGTLKLKTKVNKILIKNRQAIGVELENGEKIFAKHVVSNADTKKTFLELIDKEDQVAKFSKQVNSMEQSMSGFTVKLAVDADLSEFKNYAWFVYSPEYGAVNNTQNFAKQNIINLEKSCFSIDTANLIDADAASDNISIVNLTLLPVSYYYRNRWNSHNRQDYNGLKIELAKNLIKKAEKFIPDLSEKILYMDVSTPLTYERYTLATEGAWYDIALTPNQSAGNRLGPDTYIKRLYLTGGKSTPGPGLNAAIPSGLYTADMILGKKLTGGLCYLKPELINKC